MDHRSGEIVKTVTTNVKIDIELFNDCLLAAIEQSVKNLLELLLIYLLTSETNYEVINVMTHCNFNILS